MSVLIYTKTMFQTYFERTSRTELYLRQIWRTISTFVTGGVSRIKNSTWNNLWIIMGTHKSDFVGFELSPDDLTHVMQSVNIYPWVCG